MKILSFSRILLSISTILPVPGNVFTFKVIDFLKTTFLLLSAGYAVATTFAFTVAHLDNLPLAASAMYVCLGGLISVALSLSFYLQQSSVLSFFEDVETLINRRISAGDFGHAYYNMDRDVTSIIKKLTVWWCTTASILMIVPFLVAFVNYIIGNYSKSSWKLIYASQDPMDMSLERNIIIVATIQSLTGIPSLVYPILASQCLFYSIVQYFSTIIEDIKMMIEKYDTKTIRKDLIDVINLHRTSLKLMKCYSCIMRAPVFIVNSFILICLCTILLQLKDSVSRRDYADLYLAILASVFVTQVMFSYCYLGAKLTAKAAEINGAIYSTEWYNYSCKTKMFIILIMIRAQKPFVITGYSLVSCNLESFKNMLNFVASVFVLLLKFSD